jgi:hypothetical protein
LRVNSADAEADADGDGEGDEGGVADGVAAGKPEGPGPAQAATRARATSKMIDRERGEVMARMYGRIAKWGRIGPRRTWHSSHLSSSSPRRMRDGRP